MASKLVSQGVTRHVPGPSNLARLNYLFIKHRPAPFAFLVNWYIYRLARMGRNQIFRHLYETSSFIRLQTPRSDLQTPNFTVDHSSQYPATLINNQSVQLIIYNPDLRLPYTL